MSYNVRRIFSAVLVALVTALFAGCARVNPAPDFARADHLIQASTGLPTVAASGVEEAEVRSALSDGLSLDEALRLALLNNRQLQSQFLTIGIAKADLTQAGLLTNPSLSLLFLLPVGGGQADIQASVAQNGW